MKKYVFSVFFMALMLGTGCKKQAPVKPKDVIQPSVYKVLKDAFNKITLNPQMFENLKRLHDYVADKPAAKDWKAAAETYGWAAVRVFSRAFVEARDKVEAVIGGTLDNRVATVDFANQLIKMAQKAGDKKLENTLNGLIFLFTDDQPKKGQVKTLYSTAMQVPELRIFLVKKLTDLLQDVMDAPEALRAKASAPLLRLLPKPPKGVDKGDYALREGAARLGKLANAGYRAWPGVAHALAVVVRDVTNRLAKKRVALGVPYPTKALTDFALPQVKESFATPGALMEPMDVLTVTKDAVYFGTRPVMFLKSNTVGYFFGAPEECWPGKQVFTAQEIHKKGLRYLAKFEKAMEGFMDYADQKEAALVGKRKLPAGLNKDRTKDVPGRSALVLVDRMVPAWLLRSALHLMDREHYTDLRFVRGDDHNMVIPVLYKHVLPLEKMPPGVLNHRMYVRVKKDRIVMLGTGLKCKAPDTKKLNPVLHVRLKKAKGPKKPAKLQVWFKISDVAVDPSQAVGDAATLLDQSCGRSFFVNVAPGKDVKAGLIFQVIYGLTAYGKSRIDFFPGYFPGLGCGKAQTVCMAHIPVLFGPAGPPRKAKVVETRPMGFCDKDDIKRVMLKWGGRFRYCYESQLQRTGGKIGGRLQIRFIINQQGHVETPKVISDTVGNAHVSRCVQKIVKGLTFKKPQGGICVVQWPFVFRPH